MGKSLTRLSARVHLLGLIAAAVLPVWLFAAYLLVEYALQEQARFEQVALQTARQVSLVVEGELANLKTILDGLSKSASLANGDLNAFHDEAVRLVEGTDEVVALRNVAGNQLTSTDFVAGRDLPSVPALTSDEVEALKSRGTLISDVFFDPHSNGFRIAVLRQIVASGGDNLMLSLSVPTARIRDVMLPAVPEDWTVGVGDRDGNYVARSKLHEEMSGKPGLPEYVAKIVGRSGSFQSRNFEGTTLLAGYFRSPDSDWFYTANVSLSKVRAPLWRSLAAIGGIGLTALIVSLALAYIVGKSLTKAAMGLADRAYALGHGQAVEPMTTSVAEFDTIAQALVKADVSIAERTRELETVLETVPAAVWFTYDPKAHQVIRNRFAAELMGLPTQERKSFGTPDLVIDTLAYKDGRPVTREERPLSRAMRGEQTDNEEFTYALPSGVQRHLLSSARPIRNPAGSIIGAVQISLDISERKRSEEQRKLLVNELNHRVKNTLAVVQSIASQTIRNATSLSDAGRALASRLISLAKAHDMLTRENWEGAELAELIRASIKPHASLDRFKISGEPVWMPPNLALSLALAFHELTTNALKHGALSNPTGSVSVWWTVSSEEDQRRLELEWHELGGPPVVRGGRQGFGTQLLQRIFDSGPSGGVALTFAESGLQCTLRLTLPSPQSCSS